MGDRLPPELRALLRRGSPAGDTGLIVSLESRLTSYGLATVCREAFCPNRGSCYSRRHVTFLILGKICTRGCPFCGVTPGTPSPVDPDEPARISASVSDLNLDRLVLTSVTRDDLSDGGASHFAACCRRVLADHPGIKIEILIPDFGGEREAILTAGEAGAAIVGHNLETVPRIYPDIRPGADYHRSLKVLRILAETGRTVRSGLMVGLGETDRELFQVLEDIYAAGAREVVLGQYLAPSKRHLPVNRYLPLAAFDEFRKAGYLIGFHRVLAHPLARSSWIEEST